MRWIHKFTGRLDRELDEELRFHVDRQIQDNLAAGMTPQQARSAALRQLGGVEQIKEECRDVKAFPAIETLAQDFRFAVRTFRRRSGLAFAALSILAFGIGSGAAIFSVVNGVLLNPLPYREPQRLVRLFGVWEQGAREGISPPDFLDYRGRARMFESLAAASNFTPLLNLKGNGAPEQIQSRNVTAGFFRTLGIRPLLGREFNTEEEAWKGPKAAILSYGLWQRQFGGDPTVIGRPIAINGVLHTIVGVTPRFYNLLGPTELFTPAQPNPVPEMRGIRTMIVIGRLKPGVSSSSAQSELDILSRDLQSENPRFDRGWSIQGVSLTDEVVSDVRPALLLLFGAVGLVVLLVSANVASLMLSLATSRRTEISIRLALGASRFRVARQLMTESLVLALTGGALGCALGFWAVDLIRRLGPANIPRLAEVSVDFQALAFTLALSVAMGVLFGLEPALRAGSADIGEALKNGGRTFAGRGGLRGTLVVAEIAISVMLLVGAGQLIHGLSRLQRVDPGFQPAGMLTTRIALPGAKYSDATGARLNAFWKEAVRRIETIPGVAGAALTSELPLSGLNNPTPKLATTTDGKVRLLSLRSVSPTYSDVMRIPLRAGRFVTSDDRRNTPRVVVINEEFKKDVFGDRNPIGQRLTFNFKERFETEEYHAVIVGVCGSVRHTSLATAPFREAFLPLEQSPLSNYDLVVRTVVEPTSVAPSVRQAIWAIDREQAVGPIRTVEEVVDLGLAQPKFRSVIFGLFAAVALLLAAVGLYGLLNYMVSQRTREIGIRVALGASRRSILGLILGRGVALTAAGLSLGLVASLALARVLSRLVVGVGLADPFTFVAGPAVLLGLSIMASYFPARRAMRLDPIATLKDE